jgi:aminoglycoside 3-N-acetyltransferase
MEKVVRYEDIVTNLRVLGIKEGDTLLVHSALSSMGKVDGGPATVIRALLDLLGEEGTLVMSTLTMWDKAFDPEKTPSAVGIISEVFRKMPGVKRSLHPVHSVAAFGKNAEYITADHDKCETGCGEGTPYLKLREFDAKVMLLGVDMDRNTIMHSLEEAIDAKYLRTLDIPAPTYIHDYHKKTFTLKKFPPGHRDFLKLTPYLRRKGKLIQGYIGLASVKIMSINDLFEIGLGVLEKDPLFFICEKEVCNSCNWSRKLYGSDEIDLSLYHGNGCEDDQCEICVI